MTAGKPADEIRRLGKPTQFGQPAALIRVRSCRGASPTRLRAQKLRRLAVMVRGKPNPTADDMARDR